MENMLIRISAFLLIFINLFCTAVKAEGENLKQCFYIVAENQSSKSLNEELDSLKSREVPVIVIINPNEKISKNVIEMLEKLQKENRLTVLLENDNRLEKTYFAENGYDKKLKLSGLCSIQKDKFFYTGEKDIYFNLIGIAPDPLKTLAEINKKQKTEANYALVVSGDKFNISTLLLADNELKGIPLKVPDYRFYLKKPALIYQIFVYAGDFTIVLFSVSIVIFIAAVIIFKKWSRERFLY